MSIPKPLLLILVGVIVLFVVLVGVGVARDDVSPNPADHGWTDLLQFGGAPEVGVNDIVSSDCFSPALLQFSVSSAVPSCTTEIGESGDRARLLTLDVLQTGGTVRVSLLPRDSDGVELDEVRLESGESITASVGPGGARLVISCSGGCILDLAR